jgi:hypothetical protein
MFGCDLRCAGGTLLCAAALVGSFSLCAAAGSDDPFADVMIAFEPGSNPAPGYTDPFTTLGSPERFTGEDFFPSVVSPFSGPYGIDEIVSIGAGGHLIVKFNTPVTNDPNNLYGIDLLVFCNTSFIDDDYPNGLVGGLFSNDGGTIEISDDGDHWELIKDVAADGPMPTMGYLDSGPFDSVPGSMLTDFTRPVDPALTLQRFLGLTHPQVVERYRGSGGGVGIDIGAVGLQQISYVRIKNLADAIDNIEIDAFSDVSPRLPGDVNLDGSVNVIDLLAVISSWGVPVPGGPPADFNNDGVVNVIDLLAVINNWAP